MSTKDRSRLLQKIQAEDFAVYEVALYLDCHPGNKKALAFLHQHSEEAKQLKQEYEAKYGPLTHAGVNDTMRWTWIDGPWPWEKEGN